MALILDDDGRLDARMASPIGTMRRRTIRWRRSWRRNAP